MTKTCYFCKRFGECDVYSDTQACSDDFKPNADWIEYEELKKKDEELHRINLHIKGLCCDTKIDTILQKSDFQRGEDHTLQFVSSVLDEILKIGVKE